MKTFPKTIYVAIENEGKSDAYLTVAQDAFEGEDETRTVAKYQLVELGDVVVERTYRPRRKR